MLKQINIILGVIFLLFGAYLFLDTFRQGVAIGTITSFFFLVFGIILLIVGFKGTRNVEKEKTTMKKENKLTKIATMLLIISIISTIVALWWGRGEGYAIFLPFFVIVPLFIISFILYIISMVKRII